MAARHFPTRIAAVIEREPDWQALPSSTPAAIPKLLRRCLTKPVGRRLRDIGDAVLDLESASAADESVRTPAPATDRKWFRARSALIVTAAALTAAAVIVASSAWWRGAPESALALESMTRLTSDSGLTTEPTISADGRIIAYASNRSGDDHLDVYVQQTSGGAAIRAHDRSGRRSLPDGITRWQRRRGLSFGPQSGRYLSRAGAGRQRSPHRTGWSRATLLSGRPIHCVLDRRVVSASFGLEKVRGVYVITATGGTPMRMGADVRQGAPAIRCGPRDGQSLLIFGRDARGADPDWWWVPLTGGKSVKTGVYPLLAARHLDVTTTTRYPLPQAWDDHGVLFSSAADHIGDTRALWRIAIDGARASPLAIPFRLTRGTTIDILAVSVDHESCRVCCPDPHRGRGSSGCQSTPMREESWARCVAYAMMTRKPVAPACQRMAA